MSVNNTVASRRSDVERWRVPVVNSRTSSIHVSEPICRHVVGSDELDKAGAGDVVGEVAGRSNRTQ
jgi:hypothetical protein